jgi:50S ribosomal subunit-associated GTPase HflX
LNKKTLELKSETDNLVQISALNKINLNKLINAVNDKLESFLEVTFSIPLNNDTMAFLSGLYEKDVIVDLKYGEKNAVLRTSSKTWIINRIRSQVHKLKGEIMEQPM